MIRAPISRRRRIVLGVFSFVFLILGYSFLSYRTHQENPTDRTVPNAAQFIEGVSEITSYNEDEEANLFLADFAASGARFGKGLVAAAAISLFLALLMGCSSHADAFLAGPLVFQASIPSTAILGIILAVIGMGEEFYVLMVCLGVVSILAVAGRNDARAVPDELVYKAYSLGSSHLEAATNVIFPLIMPRFIDSLRLQVCMGLVVLVAAEYIIGDVGIGFRIRYESRDLNMPVVYFYVGLLGVCAMLIDKLMLVIRRRLCPWYEVKR